MYFIFYHILLWTLIRNDMICFFSFLILTLLKIILFPPSVRSNIVYSSLESEHQRIVLLVTCFPCELLLDAGRLLPVEDSETASSAEKTSLSWTSVQCDNDHLKPIKSNKLLNFVSQFQFQSHSFILDMEAEWRGVAVACEEGKKPPNY